MTEFEIDSNQLLFNSYGKIKSIIYKEIGVS